MILLFSIILRAFLPLHVFLYNILKTVTPLAAYKSSTLPSKLFPYQANIYTYHEQILFPLYICVYYISWF